MPYLSLPHNDHLNSADLHQSQEHPRAKVGWTCPPQFTSGRRPCIVQKTDKQTDRQTDRQTPVKPNSATAVGVGNRIKQLVHPVVLVGRDDDKAGQWKCECFEVRRRRTTAVVTAFHVNDVYSWLIFVHRVQYYLQPTRSE